MFSSTLERNFEIQGFSGICANRDFTELIIAPNLLNYESGSCCIMYSKPVTVAHANGTVKQRKFQSQTIGLSHSTSPCPILVMSNDRLGSDKYKLLSHCFDSAELNTAL